MDAFEREVAQYAGVEGALALSSGTAGLHLALKLAGAEKGEVVFCSTLTFVASVNPVLYQGAQPVFIDAEPSSWNMSPAALERALEDYRKRGLSPRAAVVVNLYGQSADYDKLLELCQHYGVTVVEDAAESLGATYRGRKSGTLGRYGAYSFNGNKIITTSGGGMLLSNDTEALKKARFWSTQAREAELQRVYRHREVGYNYRLSNLLAAVGRAQLKVLEERVRRRREVFELYRRELSAREEISFMPEAGYGRSTRWLTALTLDPERGIEPSSVIEALEEENIEARRVWKPMHRQPLFAGCDYYPHRPGESVSDYLFDRGLCLPSGSSLQEKEQERVIETICKALERQGR